MSRRIGLVASIILLTVLYLWLSAFAENKQRTASVSTFAENGTGTSAFVDFLKQSKRNITINQQAILTAGQIVGNDVILVLSPIGRLSQRESEILDNFVRQGGLLILSAHNAQSLNNLWPLMERLRLDVKLIENPDFKNEEIIETFTREHTRLFKAGEQYAVYSPWIMDGRHCQTTEFDCYFLNQEVGRGEVLFMTGLPVFNNALLSHKDNRAVAFRLRDLHRSFLIDEYHHFFSDKTFWDLLSRPAFLLTLIGMALSVILFFVFGHSRFHETSKLPDPKVRPQSAHALNEKLLLRAVDEPRGYTPALNRHIQLLLTLHPREAGAIQKETEALKPKLSENVIPQRVFLERAKSLIQFHAQFLRKKGRL